MRDTEFLAESGPATADDRCMEDVVVMELGSVSTLTGGLPIGIFPESDCVFPWALFG